MIIGVLPRPPRFLTGDELLTLHASVTGEFGGSEALRDRTLLDAAAAMPAQSAGGAFAHDVPFGMAAAYGFHLCQNHPFVDGNKRIAFAAMVVFLRSNGWLLEVTEETAAATMLSIASGDMDKAALSEWIAGAARPRPAMELRDFFSQLDYAALSSMFGSIAAGPSPERVATIMEAGQAIPSIHTANLGAMHAESSGAAETALVLRHHSILLTAIYRIAEELGYEW